MSKIDDELAQAVATSEAALPAVAASVAAAPEQPPRGNRTLLVAVLVVAAAVASLALFSFEGAAVYSRGVDQLAAEPMYGRKLRIEGSLVKGSLEFRAEPCEYKFRVKGRQKQIEVRYPQCIVPDTFRDRPDMDVDVTAEGKLLESGTFEASLILAKCPSKYDMKERAKKGEKAPHAALLPMPRVGN